MIFRVAHAPLCLRYRRQMTSEWRRAPPISTANKCPSKEFTGNTATAMRGGSRPEVGMIKCLISRVVGVDNINDYLEDNMLVWHWQSWYSKRPHRPYGILHPWLRLYVYQLSYIQGCNLWRNWFKLLSFSEQLTNHIWNECAQQGLGYWRCGISNGWNLTTCGSRYRNLAPPFASVPDTAGTLSGPRRFANRMEANWINWRHKLQPCLYHIPYN